jgi:hypothetical protein
MLTIMLLFHVVTISMQGLGIIWNFKKQNWVEWLSSSTYQWDKCSTHSCLKREFPTVLIPLNQYKSSYVPIHAEKLGFLQELRACTDTSDSIYWYISDWNWIFMSFLKHVWIQVLYVSTHTAWNPNFCKNKYRKLVLKSF